MVSEDLNTVWTGTDDMERRDGLWPGDDDDGSESVIGCGFTRTDPRDRMSMFCDGM